MLAAYFVDYPGPRQLLPDRVKRHRVLRRMLTATTRDAARHGLALVAVEALGPGEQERVLGAVLAMPPGCYPLTWRRRARKLPALLWAACAMPWSFPRYLRSVAARKATLPAAGSWWYIHTLGAYPDARNHDLIAQLVRHVLDRVDGAGLPCYAHTASAEAVAFYREFGFVVDEPVVDGAGDAYVRLARPPAGAPGSDSHAGRSGRL